jgi:drug efflux transport system permease protein
MNRAPAPPHVLLPFIRLRALLGKEFRQLLRDPRMRFFVVVPPLLQLMVFGYAATYDVRHADVALVDQGPGAASRALAHDVAATGHFTLHRYPDMAAAADAVDRGRVRAVLHFPLDFADRRVVQVVADGSDSNSAQIVAGQLTAALLSSAAADAARPPVLQIEERAWYNPNLDDRIFFVPGIIANVVFVATMSLMAMTVVRERELGTLERLLVTPVARLEFVLSKMLPVAAVGMFDVALVGSVAVAWFGVPFRGSILALLLGAALFLMSSLGLGLLISSYAGTQQQAMLLSFFIIMPAIVLSGFAFPIANMPRGVQLATWLDPLRYFLVVIRDVFLKAGGLSDHLFQFALMALLGTLALGLSVLRVR